MRQGIIEIFEQCFRDLRPRTPLPALSVAFKPFANINNTIRVREGKVLVRLSDLLESAPDDVITAIAHILLAKLYRKPIEHARAARYRKYISSRAIADKAQLVRQARGRKRLHGPQGLLHDLDAIFDDLNQRFFHGLLGRPRMSWSPSRTRRILGHYDPAHNAILISRIFDHSEVPLYVLEYIVYHEMLHLKHPVRLRGSRRCIHSPEFQSEEKQFPQFAEANAFLKRV